MSRAKKILESLNEGKVYTMNLSGDAMVNLNRDMLKDSGTSLSKPLMVGKEKLGGNYEFKVTDKELQAFLKKNDISVAMSSGVIFDNEDKEDIWGLVK